MDFYSLSESAPKAWREILDDTHLRWVESPLHDRDVNPDGEIKKAHWHILLSYDGPVNLVAVKKLTDKLNALTLRKFLVLKGL